MLILTLEAPKKGSLTKKTQKHRLKQTMTEYRLNTLCITFKGPYYLLTLS